MDSRLKEMCPRPISPPPRGEATYLDLMNYAVNAQLTIECDERKVIDLGKSIDGPAEAAKKTGWFGW